MRHIPVLFALLLIAVPTSGAPGPSSQPPAAQEATQQFARQLFMVATRVNESYIHPVPLPNVFHAALSGLYVAARQPVPADFKERVEKAVARGDVVLLVQETHARTEAALTALGRKPMTVACQALFRSLDPYSGVINPEEQRRNAALDQDAQGVGIDLFDYAGVGPLVIKSVYPGGSAQRAGLRPGDQITHVTGTPVESTGARIVGHVERLEEKLLKSPPEDTLGGPPKLVQLTFQRRGGPPKTVELDSRRFRAETVLGVSRDDGHHWIYWADYKKRIAHVRITMLSHGTDKELAAVLDELLEQEVRGLILDLRWTPGGYLDESVGVAQLFLGDVQVATVKARNEADSVYHGNGPSKLTDLPLVVLVNGETSGGAELIAAALQDHKRAIVVGQRTLGKASVQRPLHLDVQDVQLKMTTGTFYRPSGKNLHRFPDSKPGDDWGVKPDVEFRVSAQLGAQLKEWWQEQTLRPGPSLERLPLDDPSTDAQRRAAVDALSAILDKKPEVKDK